MPTNPFLEPRAEADRHRIVADASEITRYRRLAAQLRPFQDALPKPRWRDASAATEARQVAPVLGFLLR